MEKQPINEWTLCREGFPACSGSVPCSLYSILLDNGLIPDPFFGDNEYDLKKLSDSDCDFTADFFLSKEIVRREHLTVRFSGLDTLATVYVNGKEVGTADNMHRVWEYDLKAAALPGRNAIRIHFSSPTVYMDRKQDENYVFGDANSGRGIAHLRKSLCMSGWDWGPALPDMGIYRPVEILGWDGARIDDLMLHQEHSGGKVRLDASLTLTEGDFSCAVLSVTSPDGKAEETAFEGGKASVTVNDPALWWPNGLGDHPLYQVKVTLYRNGEVSDVCEKRVGLRTLEVSRKKDDSGDPASGEEFCFVCNGVKFFAMGADYIPEDSILSRITRDRTEKLLRDCVDSNFNCLRVWGGGFYPHDDFYDLCDELGLVVWQDFMFACMDVRLFDGFADNIRKEAVDNIRRLRHHASLGLFCGNNEMELATVEGWDKSPLRNTEAVRRDYLAWYEDILPKICREHCPDVFYWQASPSSGGNFDDPNDENRGDVHYWGAWHGSIPFESYRQYKFRFLSEFGFESFPNIKTVRSFAKEEDMNPFSYIMESHQKCKGGNTKILTYLADKYLYPTSFEKLVYTSQLLQADAIRYGVEHFRRFRGRCMGAVYWQLNDCWPVASWASIDWFGRPKALQYAAKRFFAPTLLSAHENGTTVTFNVSNEKRQPFVGSVTVRLQKTDFTLLDEKVYPVSVDAMSASDIATVDYAAKIAGQEREVYLAYTLWDAEGTAVSRGSLLFSKPKHFRFPDPDIRVSIEGEKGEFCLKVKASAYARSVEIDFARADLRLCDNYFDLTDRSETVLFAKTEDKTVTKEDLVQQLSVTSVFSLSK